jgi:DNA-binding Lrp family transcriptional regulator
LIYKLLTIILQVTSAFLLINVEFPFEDDVMAKLRDIYEIVDVYRVQGMYDIIAKVELDKEEELKELVSERIRKVDRITGTVTIMIAQGKVEGGGK